MVTVKSRRLSHEELRPNKRGRPEAPVDFQIKASEIDLICKDPNGFLILVVFVVNRPNRLGRLSFHLWFQGKHLRGLLEHGYMHLEAKVYHIQVVIRLFPTLDVRGLLQKLVVEKNLSTEGGEQLKEKFPDRVECTWHASEYLSLVQRTNDTQKPVIRMVPEAFTDFRGIGSDVSLAELWEPAGLRSSKTKGGTQARSKG